MLDVIFKMTEQIRNKLGYTNSVLKHSSQWLMGDSFDPTTLTTKHKEEIIKALDEDLVMGGSLNPDEYDALIRDRILYIFPKGFVITEIEGLDEVN